MCKQSKQLKPLVRVKEEGCDTFVLKLPEAAPESALESCTDATAVLQGITDSRGQADWCTRHADLHLTTAQIQNCLGPCRAT